jgi:hypothetical protein
VLPSLPAREARALPLPTDRTRGRLIMDRVSHHRGEPALPEPRPSQLRDPTADWIRNERQEVRQCELAWLWATWRRRPFYAGV